MPKDEWWLTVSAGLFGYYLINALKGNRQLLIRPPGALEEDEFLAVCVRCGQCQQVCHYGSIKIAGGDRGISIGTPYLELRETPCYLCMECVKVCPSGALRPLEKEDVRMGIARVDRRNCLAWGGSACEICYLMCPFRKEAIVLQDFTKPLVDGEKCVGCGICEFACVKDSPAIVVGRV